MPAQEILENLAKLESNLRNIDSARKQVETLSNSYDATEKQLKSVALEITSIVNDLNIIFKTIKSNNDLTSKEIDSKVKAVIQALMAKIIGIQTEVEDVKKSFNHDCTLIVSKLQASANNSLDTVQNGISGIISALNDKANEEMNKLVLTIESFQNAAQGILVDYKTSMESISSKFNDDMQGFVESFNKTKQDLDHVVELSKEQSQTLLKSISQEVAKIDIEIKGFDFKLNQKLEEKFTDISAVVNLNSSKLDEIYNRVSREAENAIIFIKDNDVKQEQYLEGKFLNIDLKLNSHSKEFNLIDESIVSSSANIIKGIGTNRKLIIVLIVAVLFSLLFNLAKFIL